MQHVLSGQLYYHCLSCNYYLIKFSMIYKNGFGKQDLPKNMNIPVNTETKVLQKVIIIKYRYYKTLITYTLNSIILIS